MSLSIENMGLTLASVTIVKPFSLNIAPREVVTLMGPSGSGKTSILAAISGGLADVFQMSGRILVNGRDLTNFAPARRRIGRLFQDDLLFPHLTVGENLLFGMAQGPRAHRLFQMREALQEIGLESFENRGPHTLSGGQRQRVALMRSLLAKPDAMLLDEPFSKLDENLRSSMRELTFAKLAARSTPALLVTHDYGDAPPEGQIFKIDSAEVKRVR